MMERSRIIGALALALFAAGCNAPSDDAPREDIVAQRVDEAPADPARVVAGLTLGRPAYFDECSKERKYDSVRYTEVPEQLPCWMRQLAEQRQMSLPVERGVPRNARFDVEVPTESIPSGVHTRLIVDTIDGNVERIHLGTSREILSLLVEKWGEPTTSNVEAESQRRHVDLLDVSWELETFSVVYYYGDMGGSLSVNSARYDALWESTRPKHSESL